MQAQMSHDFVPGAWRSEVAWCDNPTTRLLSAEYYESVGFARSELANPLTLRIVFLRSIDTLRGEDRLFHFVVRKLPPPLASMSCYVQHVDPTQRPLILRQTTEVLGVLLRIVSRERLYIDFKYCHM